MNLSIESQKSEGVALSALDSTIKQPDDIPGLELWYDLSQETVYSDTDEITTLHDYSGNSRDVVPNVAESGAVYSVTGGPNSTPTAVFNGIAATEGYMSTLFTAISQPFTYFIIYQTDAWIANTWICDGGVSTEFRLYQGTATPNIIQRTTAGTGDSSTNGPVSQFNYLESVFNGASSYLALVDESQATAGDVGSTQLSGFSIGRRGGTDGGATSFFEGKISEIIVYSRDLSLTNEQKYLREYMATKYGITTP